MTALPNARTTIGEPQSIHPQVSLIEHNRKDRVIFLALNIEKK